MPLSLINTNFSFFEIKNAISFMLNKRNLSINDLDSIISEYFIDENVALTLRITTHPKSQLINVAQIRILYSLSHNDKNEDFKKGH